MPSKLPAHLLPLLLLPLLIMAPIACDDGDSSDPQPQDQTQETAEDTTEPDEELPGEDLADDQPEDLPPETAEDLQEDPGEEDSPQDLPDLTPVPKARVLLTLAGHIEDTAIYTNCDAFPEYRADLLSMAELLADRGVAMNMQIDYEFLFGVSRCETPEMRAETNGMNVLDYLARVHHWELDAHQEGGFEEGQDNYADVHYTLGQLTDTVSDVVGGFIWEDPDQFLRLAQGEAGLLHPEYTWHPEILCLAVGFAHHQGNFAFDDTSSGVWKPTGAGEDHFWQHNPEEHLIYIGPGEHTNWGNASEKRTTVEFMNELVLGIEQGDYPDDQIYTSTVTIPQSVLFFQKEKRTTLIEILDDLQPFVDAGIAEYKTYSQIARIWRDEYNEVPNIFHLN